MVDYYTIGTADIGDYSSAAIKQIIPNPFNNYTTLRVQKLSPNTLMAEAIGLYISKHVVGYIYFDDQHYVWSGWGNYILVWTNPSPSSKFLAQNVYVDLSKYSFVIVNFKELKEGGNFWTTSWAPINNTASIHSCLQWTGNTLVGLVRQFTPDSGGITFSDAYNSDGTSMVVNNDKLIPVTIYGTR